MTALVLSCIGIPEKTFAASKKAKTTYSVSVSNINSNTVLKKGAKIKIAYKATKKKNGVAKGAKVKASSTRGRDFGAGNIVDGEYDSYWAAPDGVTEASLTFDLGVAKTFNLIQLQEYMDLMKYLKTN